MAPKTFYCDAGALRELLAVFYRDGGVLRDVQKIFYRHEGELQLVFEKITSEADVVLTDVTVFQLGEGMSQIAGYRANASGVIQKRFNGLYTTHETWLLAGVESDFEFRATQVSGDTVLGDSLSTWVGATCEWYVQATLPLDVAEAVLTVEVRPAGGGATLATCEVSLYAERDEGG